MLLAAIVAGAAWGMIPAVFKAFWNTNETLFTLMMNYVAIQFVVLYVEKNRGLTSSSLGIINGIDKSGWLPVLGNATVLPAILISVILVAMYFYIVRSKQGYEVTVVGESLNTARYAGINVKAVIIRTMAISGAVCGFIGFCTFPASITPFRTAHRVATALRRLSFAGWPTLIRFDDTVFADNRLLPKGRTELAEQQNFAGA